MRHIEPGTVELTDAEQAIKDEHTALLDRGFSEIGAVSEMLAVTLIDSPTWDLLNNDRFRNYLNGHTCLERGLVFQGTMGAPGVGNTYKCPFCSLDWVNVGGAWYVPDEEDGDSEPPWVLSIADVI